MSVSWLHVYILLIYVHIVHCKKYKTLLLPKPIQPIGSIIKDTPSNSIAFYYITFHSHSHDLGIPMDTTIWGNTPLLQPIWSEWLNYTRVCSEPCTICISREEPWQKNKNVTPWYQISEKVTILYATISMFCIFGIQLNPLQKQRSNPVAVQQATRQRRPKSSPSDYVPQHQSTHRPWKQPSAESGHNETHLPTWDEKSRRKGSVANSWSVSLILPLIMV